MSFLVGKRIIVPLTVSNYYTLTSFDIPMDAKEKKLYFLAISRHQ